MSNITHALGVCLLLAFAPSALAEKLEITGEIMPTTCEVSTSSGTITVAMGKVELSSINADTRAGQKNFSILLDCSGAGTDQNVAVRFGGTSDGSTGNLALTGASTAGNVGVALYDAAGNHQKIGDDPVHWVTIPAAGSGQLDYSAWYASPSQNATAGTANASGSFVVVYN
ncbi:fimbrial protein [Stenotrophomonas maltophilia]|uniref:fimbrial protein n=1 Tax=Stenotrophomonas maltophilia TaxID=40324 RepID=UPI0015DF6684|nr:fimbrial protein [Stenotrophomonas maltophilia]MBA0446640.1 type 1 fimbrial protein [Stenotrophomonas maltophilia]